MSFVQSIQSRPLRIGFIGGGLNSAVGYVHYASSHLDGLFKLEAGCFSRNTDTNRATALRYGVDHKRTYSCWRDFAASEQKKLDAVVVLTPTPNHPEVVNSLLRAGHNVICEKALASSVQECLDIQRTIDETAGFLVVTYNYSGYPMFRELVARCRAGELGDIHQIHIEMPQEGFLRRQSYSQGPVPQAWRCVDYGVPTVSLDLGVHLHHLVDVVSGGLRPHRVSAVQSHSGLVNQVVDNVNALVEYENNMVVNVWYGKTALGIRNGLRVRLYGSNGSGEWLQSEPERLRLAKNDGCILTLDPGSPGLLEASQPRYQRFKPGHPSGFIEAFGNLYSDIAAYLWQRRGFDIGPIGPVKGVEHALEGLYLFEALHAAARSGCWISTQRA
jgi:predicted dehydrogenase